MTTKFQLCYVTDRHALEPKPLLSKIREAIRAGVDMVQIREKDLSTRELVELAKAALDAAQGTKTRIVINDRLDVALALGASGIHLGSRSMPARVVREILSKRGAPQDFLVGVSCHSLEEALAARSDGADYVVLGPVFETPSKLSFGPPLGLAKLQQVTRRVSLPVLAVGGITLDRVNPCLKAGAAGIAAIRLFQDCDSMEARVRELRREFTL